MKNPFRPWRFVPARALIFLVPLIALSFVPSSEDWEKDIIKKIKTYQAILRQEKLFVQTDRPVYVAGEDVWFSAFLLDAASQMSNRSECVLYVELIKPTGTTASKQIFKLNKGRAWGNLNLDAKLPGGEYLLVAYTNWMRNFGSEFFFRQHITVVGDGVGTSPSKEVAPSAGSGDQQGVVADIGAAGTVPNDSKLLLAFYPEGGDLVEGVKCKVAYEGLTQYGQSANFQGVVVDDQGQTVCTIGAMWEGKGYFSITPEPGRTYTAQIDGPNDAKYNFALPVAKPEGFQLAIEDPWQSPDLIISVHNMSQTQQSEAVFLLGLQDGVPKMAMKGILANGVSMFKVAKSDFASGIVQFTLFDSNKQPRCERLAFVNNNHSLTVSIRPVELPSAPRGRVEFELLATEKDGKPAVGDFAVAVTDARRIPDEAYRSANMAEYLALTSNLPGNVPNPSVLFENSRKSVLKADLLMLTNGWRRYSWNKVMADTIQIPSYLEEPGIYVQGNVLRKSTMKKAPQGIDVSMLVAGKMQVFSEKTGANGDFTFLLGDFNDTLNAVVQTRNKMNTNTDYVIDLNSNLKSRPSDSFNKLFLRTSDEQAVSFIPTVEKSGITIEKGTLKTELTRALKTDFFVDTTDVTIDEVTVTADKVKTAKEKITGQYGAPDQTVNKKQIEKLVKDNPWQFGLMSILGDAIPGLYVDYRATTFKRVTQTSGMPANSSMQFSNSPSIEFKLANKMPHRFFIYVDGEMVGASDDKGVLTSMLRLYTLDELVSMDPEVVASVELTFPKKGKNANVLHSQAALNAGIQDAADDATTSEAPADETADASETAATGTTPATMPELYTSPEAILSIYTVNGAGMHAKTHYKGIVNVTLQGFSKVKEFYQPNYMGDRPDKVMDDRRNTLAWLPSVKTDSLGKARFSFFTSDEANSFRVEVNGVSSSGLPGSFVGKANSAEFKLPETANAAIQPSGDVNAGTGRAQALFSVLLANGSPAPFVDVAVVGKEWGTFTDRDGHFAIDSLAVADTDKLMFSRIGYKTQVVEVWQCAKSAVVLETVQPSRADLAVADLLKRMAQKQFSNRNPNNFVRQGVFRERVLDNNQLMRLSDFTFVQKWPALANTSVTIDTRLLAGRRYRTDNYSAAIGFEPQNKYNDAVPLMDPVYRRMSFIDPNFAKNYEYQLKGTVDFQGRTMYWVTFDQTDKTQWVFYSGQMLIDAATYGLAWVQWRVSDKAKQWLMPDEYLASGGDQATFKVLAENNETTYGFNGSFWVPKTAVSDVQFSNKGAGKGYVREMVWYAPGNTIDAKVKGLSMEQMKRRNMLLKSPTYFPNGWRNPWFLTTDAFLADQIKYLNELTIYSETEEK